jgi:hypothetical protein
MFGNKTQAREWTASALSLSTARNVQYLAALAQVSDVSAAQKLSYWQSAHRLPGFAHTLGGADPDIPILKQAKAEYAKLQIAIAPTLKCATVTSRARGWEPRIR